MIHDFVNHDGANLWPDVVRAQRPGGLRHKMFLALAADVTPEGDAVLHAPRPRHQDAVIGAPASRLVLRDVAVAGVVAQLVHVRVDERGRDAVGGQRRVLELR